ncbi:MAG: hypothetical protein M0R02_10320 [Bacteroidales bacterium]|nr:hypothetical protein [Bacteroidales bacterium]
MKKPHTRIVRAVGEFLLLTLFALIPPLFVFIDSVVIGHGVTEDSLTEYAQETLLLVSALLFWHGARRHPDSRGFLLLVAGFFGCALIRELDSYLDFISHGFWVWPANLLALATISYVALRCKDTVLEPMAAFIDTKPYFYMVFGLLVVFVFSRLFGSGTLLWDHLLGDNYTHSFKSGVQEGLELFGYIFIGYSAYLYIWRAKGLNK